MARRPAGRLRTCLTLHEAAALLDTDLAGVGQLIATGQVKVHQVCSGRCETLIARDSVVALLP